ncbi:hypothetical protein EIB18_12950 [Caulobacter vibrioides]|uniref:Uncharacterized protein n=1 Tax=Caulobacter vibrioides (strain ATCC 19089 / CIP 103742 / CB 15) TaxID=190650 RepID=Q9A5K2_CAUVC|nr:hypothetical protein CC_2445 [Caulobacter vibrioides CB15]ATC25434.1 hypothetical protein CA608_13310 [Caulobacter vibrioides]AZH13527.1 hypothetical protein EIB18_12950 [Caulobacter vibrioides]PLR14395.1 hypothetical protein CVUC_04255 [Caulobacter vibrioides]
MPHLLAAQPIPPRRAKLIVAVFCVLGPLIGYCVFVAPFALTGGDLGPPGFVILAYLYGGPIALLTGLVAAYHLARLASGLIYILSTTLVGAAVSCAPTVALGWNAQFILAGTFAGLTCGLASAWLRPRSNA